MRLVSSSSNSLVRRSQGRGIARISPQAEIAETDEESDWNIYLQEPELDKIVTKLAALAPTSHRDIFLLLEFVAPSLKDGLRTDGLEVDIMRNVLDAFYPVWGHELMADRNEGEATATANVHAGYKTAFGILARHHKDEAEKKTAA
jgi:hypothetical protein